MVNLEMSKLMAARPIQALKISCGQDPVQNQELKLNKFSVSHIGDKLHHHSE